MLVAANALSNVYAASLEESLKGLVEDTEISGFARMKYSISKKDDANTREDLRLSGQLNIVSPVYDNLYFGATFAADGHNYPSHEASAPIGGYNAATNKGLYVDRFYFKYALDALNVTAGKQDVSTPWTETGFNSSRGNGLSALYSGVKEWTFSAAAFLQTNGFDDTNYGNDLGSHHNMYAIGIAGKLKDIGLNLQLWGGVYEHTIEAMAYADIQYALSGFSIRGQLNYAKLNKEFADSFAFTDNDGLYYGLELGYANDNFWAKAGYAKNDKSQPIYALDGDNGGFIKYGSDLYYTGTNLINASVYFCSGGVNFDKLRLRLGYGVVDNKKIKASEVYSSVWYRLKNFDAGLTLAHMDRHGKGSDSNKAAMELLYKF
jgi:hypothetical protein